MAFTAITFVEWLAQIGLSFSRIFIAGTIFGLLAFWFIWFYRWLCTKLSRKQPTIDEVTAKVNKHLDNIDAALKRIASKLNIEKESK